MAVQTALSYGLELAGVLLADVSHMLVQTTRFGNMATFWEGQRILGQIVGRLSECRLPPGVRTAFWAVMFGRTSFVLHLQRKLPCKPFVFVQLSEILFSLFLFFYVQSLSMGVISCVFVGVGLESFGLGFPFA